MVNVETVNVRFKIRLVCRLLGAALLYPCLIFKAWAILSVDASESLFGVEYRLNKSLKFFYLLLFQTDNSLQ